MLQGRELEIIDREPSGFWLYKQTEEEWDNDSRYIWGKLVFLIIGSWSIRFLFIGLVCPINFFWAMDMETWYSSKNSNLCVEMLFTVSLSKICLWVEVFLKITCMKFVVERVRPQFMFCVIVVLTKIFGYTRVTLVVIVCFLILIFAAGWRETCVQNRVLVKCVCHGTSSLHLEFGVYGLTAIREFSNRWNQIRTSAKTPYWKLSVEPTQYQNHSKENFS